MDGELLAIIKGVRHPGGGDPHIDLVDPVGGRIEVQAAGPDAAPPVSHTLKPLAALYGKGTGRDALDTLDPAFTPLLMSIEQVFVDRFRVEPELTDAAVTVALDRLCLSPEASPGRDSVAIDVQFRLRLTLSLHDFSRSDVRHALRKVKQSVARHTRQSGVRGYLTFIRQQLAAARSTVLLPPDD